jgi:hypothetical protein
MSDERTTTAEPVTPMRDDDAGCWQHGDESITTRIEPAERVIEHCTICGKDVGWTWQAAQRSTAEVERLQGAVVELDDALKRSKTVGHIVGGATSWAEKHAALIAEARAALAEPEKVEVTRFEVIDHRLDMKGRVLVAWPCSVELSYQDGGRTLKVFVNEPR